MLRGRPADESINILKLVIVDLQKLEKVWV